MTRPRLLLVDDDPQLPFLLRILAKKSQQECLSVGSVEAAWASLASSVPDLILLDMNLPNARGTELLHRLHCRDKQAKIPVALFLHSGLWQDITQGWIAGADFLVYKNLVADSVLWAERIQEILSAPVGQPSIELLQLHGRSLIPSKEHGNRLLQTIFAGNLFRDMGEPMILQLLKRAKETLRHAQPTSEKVPGTSSTPAQVDDYYIALLHAILTQIWCLFGRKPTDTLAERIRELLSPRSQSFVHS